MTMEKLTSAFEYAPAPESRSVVDIAPSYGLFIDGEFTDAADGKVFKTVSPSSEEVLSEIAQAGEADVDRAVKAARRAFGASSLLNDLLMQRQKLATGRYSGPDYVTVD